MPTPAMITTTGRSAAAVKLNLSVVEADSALLPGEYWRMGLACIGLVAPEPRCAGHWACCLVMLAVAVAQQLVALVSCIRLRASCKASFPTQCHFACVCAMLVRLQGVLEACGWASLRLPALLAWDRKAASSRLALCEGGAQRWWVIMSALWRRLGGSCW